MVVIAAVVVVVLAVVVVVAAVVVVGVAVVCRCWYWSILVLRCNGIGVL